MSFTTTFHQYPLLPVELQIKIWKAAIHDLNSRIVHVSEIPRKHSTEENGPWTWMIDGVDVRTQEIDKTNPPHQHRSQSIVSLLYVCKLSRDLTSKIYTRAFATHPTSSYVWFDFSKDILYANMGRQSFFGEEYNLHLKTTHILNGSVTSDCNRVKNFAIVIEGGGRWPKMPYPYGSLTLGMGKCAHYDNVERIILAHRQHAWNDSADLIDTQCAEMTKTLPLLRKKDCSDEALKRLLAVQYYAGSTYHDLTDGNRLTLEGEARLEWLPKGAKGITAKIEKRTITTKTLSQEFETLVDELKQARPEDWFCKRYRTQAW